MQKDAISTRYDFVGLYNIAKYCTYLKEGFDAILETVAEISCQHEQLTMASPEKADTKSAFMHQKGLFKSANLRLASLNSRIQNIIDLVCTARNPLVQSCIVFQS